MQAFNVDKDKTLNSALYILNTLGEADYHKVFKILYFADQQHLKHYGRPLTGDCYNAMQFGPVPSFLYDVFKAAEKGTSPFAEALELAESFSVKRDGNKPIVSAAKPADTDMLSETNLEVLKASIHENNGLSFKDLTEKSHDMAWTKAQQEPDTEMSYIDIAESVDTDPEMLKYIRLNAENDLI
jgi:uncharacterized phage-associated protein